MNKRGAGRELNEIKTCEREWDDEAKKVIEKKV